MRDSATGVKEKKRKSKRKSVHNAMDLFAPQNSIHDLHETLLKDERVEGKKVDLEKGDYVLGRYGSGDGFDALDFQSVHGSDDEDEEMEDHGEVKEFLF